MATSFLQIDNLTKSYGDRMLFDGVTFGVYEGDKIGVIAKKRHWKIDTAQHHSRH